MRLTLLAAAIAVVGWRGAEAQARPQQAATATPTIPAAIEESDVLRGLRGFDVDVSIRSDLADSSTIHNRVELKLRQNGIRVGKEEFPYLLVSCVILQPKEGFVYAYTCRVEVAQWVNRTFPAPLRVLATTWSSTSHVSTVGSDNLRASVANKVDAQMDEFLNAWFKANPKEP
jgi:hypothetical protein